VEEEEAWEEEWEEEWEEAWEEEPEVLTRRLMIFTALWINLLEVILNKEEWEVQADNRVGVRLPEAVPWEVEWAEGQADHNKDEVKEPKWVPPEMMVEILIVFSLD